MARPGLTKNIKFKLLVARLGLPRAHVLGHLEFLWEWAHESGSAHLGAPDAVECAAEWQGERGALFTALRDGKWIDPAHDSDDEWIIHDYYHHAPRYVKERARKELQRQKSGAKRRTRCAAKSSQGAKRRSPPAPAPAPAHITKECISYGDTCTETLPASSVPDDPPPSEVVETFPTEGKKRHWHLTKAELAELQNYFPSLDVHAECLKALAWCKANPTKRKTARGMPAFLTNWLNRATNRGGQRAPPTPATSESFAEKLSRAEERLNGR